MHPQDGACLAYYRTQNPWTGVENTNTEQNIHTNGRQEKEIMKPYHWSIRICRLNFANQQRRIVQRMHDLNADAATRYLFFMQIFLSALWHNWSTPHPFIQNHQRILYIILVISFFLIFALVLVLCFSFSTTTIKKTGFQFVAWSVYTQLTPKQYPNNTPWSNIGSNRFHWWIDNWNSKRKPINQQ